MIDFRLLPRARKTKMAKRHRVVSAFQPDIVEIDETPLPPLANSLLYLVAGFIVSMILWASVSHMDVIIQARGQLVTATPSIVVQPLETAVIRQILVKVNDRVRKGDRLALLDPTFTAADVANIEARRASLGAERGRLEAELAGKAYPNAASPSDADIILQSTLFRERQGQYKAKLDSFDQNIKRLTGDIASKRGDAILLTERLATANDIEVIRDESLRVEYGSKLNLLQAKATRLEARRDLDTTNAAIIDLRHQLDGVQADRLAFMTDWRRSVADDLVEVKRDLEEAVETLKKAERRGDLVVLEAPADGYVLEVAPRSAGSVVKEAEPLFTITPSLGALEAEVFIEARDIGFVKVGDGARVKLDAFPSERHGTVQGKVLSIGEGLVSRDESRGNEAHGTDDGSRYFRARLALDPPKLRMVPENSRLIPGMTLTGDLVVGQRRVISYFLDPLVKGLDEGIRER